MSALLGVEMMGVFGGWARTIFLAGGNDEGFLWRMVMMSALSGDSRYNTFVGGGKE